MEFTNAVFIKKKDNGENEISQHKTIYPSYTIIKVHKEFPYLA